MKQAVQVWWIRRSLRIEDNLCLAQLLQNTKAPVLPIYIWAPDEEAPWQPGAASCWWLNHSLVSLKASLEKMGLPLLVLNQPTQSAFELIKEHFTIASIVCDELPEAALIRQEKTIQTWAAQNKIVFNSVQNNLLFNHADIRNKTDKPYQVYTPFSKTCFALMEAIYPEPSVNLSKLPISVEVKKQGELLSTNIEDLRLLPQINWDKGFYLRWQPGEAGARKRLEQFIESGQLANYKLNRDFPFMADGVSGLSPHLHFGEISPLRIWQTIREAVGQKVLTPEKAIPYLRQLLWREFAHHLLHYFPETPLNNLRKEFDGFEWNDSPELFEKWKNGETGIPIVDAGMQELWQTGWMHNRVRMITASFLTKNLLIPWQQGANYFWDTLVDADLANNTMGWQWVAGCGADAAPYFRIFNPVLQSLKFDEEAQYIRRWLPMLTNAPNSKNIHSPCQEPLLYPNYPKPVIDLYASRDEALRRYKQLR